MLYSFREGINMKNVVSVENMRKSDAKTTETTPAVELMERAAKGIFEAMKSEGIKAPVAVVCGIGNNAGDGFALAELLLDAAIDCTVFLLSDKFSDSGKYYFDRCREKGVKVSEELKLEGFGTVVDCIFGVGLHGNIGEPYRSAIKKINSSGAYIVSADINSGLGGDSGLPTDGIAVKSDLTVSVGSFKSGHFLNSAKDFIVRKVNVDIGIELLEEPAKLIEAKDIAGLFAREKNDANKGDFGYVALVGGSTDYSGAAKLANLSLSALRAGAGVSKLAVPRSIANSVMPYLLESTLFLLDDIDGQYSFSHNTTEKLLRNTKAAAIGMGMGRSAEVRRLLQYALCEYSGRLVVDADGLNELSELSLPSFKNSSCRLILTPHPKEFERLSGKKIADFKEDIISAAKEYAKTSGAILLLKGPTTVVTDGETVYLVDRGTVGMSTAGSGDVLSGILAGICGYVKDEELLLGVAAGAYLNGLAGELAAGEIPAASMLSSDTAAHIPAAMAEIIKNCQPD